MNTAAAKRARDGSESLGCQGPALTARKPVLHVVAPGMEVARVKSKPRETITAFLRRTGWATKDKKYGWQFKRGLPTTLRLREAAD